MTDYCTIQAAQPAGTQAIAPSAERLSLNPPASLAQANILPITADRPLIRSGDRLVEMRWLQANALDLSIRQDRGPASATSTAVLLLRVSLDVPSDSRGRRRSPAPRGSIAAAPRIPYAARLRISGPGRKVGAVDHRRRLWG